MKLEYGVVGFDDDGKTGEIETPDRDTNRENEVVLTVLMSKEANRCVSMVGIEGSYNRS